MSDWDYIVGETQFLQPFEIYDKRTKLQIDGTGLTTATLTIMKSDLTAVSPAITNQSLTINIYNPLRLLYTVNAGTPNVPQTEGSYRVIITLNTGAELRKTFEMDLRVYRG